MDRGRRDYRQLLGRWTVRFRLDKAGADRLEGLRLCGDSGKGSQSHQAAGPSDNQVHIIRGRAIYPKLGSHFFVRTHVRKNGASLPFEV
jgi:hypothetical protein